MTTRKLNEERKAAHVPVTTVDHGAVMKDDLPPIKHDDIEISFDETGAIPIVREPVGESADTEKDAPRAVPIEDTLEYQRLLQDKAVLADQLLRQKADFENFRKRQEREKAEFQTYANLQLILDLLPFLDNMERALEHAEHANNSGFIDGIQHIHRQVLDVLAKHGVTKIDTESVPFDPNLHQAIGFLEREDIEEGWVADEILKGYMIRDRLVRPAVVRVACAPAGGQAENKMDDPSAIKVD